MDMNADLKAATVLRYDPRTMLLHWLTAALVASLWGVAQVIDLFPSAGTMRVSVRSLHVVLGLILAGVIAARLFWRAGAGRVLPPAGTGALQLLSRLVHFALYTLVIAAIVLGIANTWVRGDSFFGLFRIPAFDPGNKALRQTVGGLHETATNAILIVAGFHAAAALAHHFLWRDGVLRRMLPARGQG